MTKDLLPSQRSPLLPDRHPQRGLFVCDIVDAVPKGDVSSMENPVFTLSPKPDMRRHRYERGENWIQIAPSHKRDLTIDISDEVFAALQQRAEETGQAPEDEAKIILIAALEADQNTSP